MTWLHYFLITMLRYNNNGTTLDLILVSMAVLVYHAWISISLIPHDTVIQANPPKLMPDLSQREPGVENPPNNAMNAAWRRGNESSKQRIDERYASNQELDNP